MNKSSNMQGRGRRKGTKGKKGGNRPDPGIAGGGGSMSTVLVERWMPVFPPTVTKWLRYAGSFGMATTSGAITSTQVFRANDLYDPDFTSTGHQPMGFDQLMVWYNHFTVRRARIVLNFQNTTASTPTVCVRVDGDSTAITNIDRILELGNCVTETLENKGVTGSTKQLSMSVDIAKLQGVTQGTITADANLRGTSASSPAEVSYFHVTMWDVNALTGTGNCQVVLEQEATFYEPRDITSSFSGKPPACESKASAVALPVRLFMRR